MDKIRNINLIGKINNTANELNELLEHLSSKGGQLHPLDKDSLLQKIQSIYNQAIMLQPELIETSGPTITAPVEITEKAIKKDDVIVSSIDETSEKKLMPTSDVNHLDEREKEHFASVDSLDNDQKEADLLWEDDSKVGSSKSRSEIKEKPIDKNTTLDLFGGNNTESLADKLASRKDNSLAAKLEQSKITDLRQAIGINEKFLFINDLFEGNLSYYNKAIDELNSFQSLNGARTYLIELSVAYSWPSESAAKEKIHLLIERKFESYAN